MIIRENTTASDIGVVVAPGRVLDHARTAVETVATRLWASERVRVGPQLPSVTNYVALLKVGDRSFMAKYSLLGTSLVSVVRGLRGTWPKVETSQQDYVADPEAQLAREYAQLRILAAVAHRGAVPLPSSSPTTPHDHDNYSRLRRWWARWGWRRRRSCRVG